MDYFSNDIEWFDEKSHLMVKEFFMVDNISFDKYLVNSKWDFRKFSYDVEDWEVHRCTPTFIKYFSKNHKRKFSNKSMGINHWFYYAYPDVAIWAEQSFYGDVEECTLNYEGFNVMEQNRAVLAFLRGFVLEFKKAHRTLECSI